MKTNNIFRSFAAMAAFLLIFAAACDEPAPEKPAVPIFPELVENLSVVSGDTLSLTFVPNMDWEVTVPEDTMDFFWLIDGAFQYSRITGKASEEAVTVKVGVSDKVDFENHTVTVKLTMGGETRIIARYMRPAVGKSIQLYACQVDEEGAWVFDSDGEYKYSESEPDTIRLVYTGADFRIPVKVVSNLEYEMELPVWARADLPQNKTGQCRYNIYGVPSEYPLDEESASIRFKYGSEIVKEYVIVIPGCRDIMTYGVDMVAQMNFTADGKYLTSIDFQDAPLTAWIEGTSLSCVMAVEMKDGKYDVSSAGGPDWLVVDMDAYSASEGAAVLQKRTVQVSAKEMKATDNERSAVLFFLPEKLSDISSLFTADHMAVKEEYEGSAVYVTQKRYGYLTLATEADFTAAKGSMKESDDNTLKSMFGNPEYAYEMTYADEWASDSGQLLFKEEYGSYKIFSKAGVEVAGQFFLSFNEDRKCIEMTGTVKDEGYIVFYDASGRSRAVVRCLYEPEAQLEEYEEDQIRDASMYFKNPEAAKTAGAVLEEIWAGPTFYDCEDARNDGAVLLRLTCAENTEVELLLPAGSYMVAGYPRDCFTLDHGSVDLSAGAAFLSSKATSLSISFIKAPASFTSQQSLALYNKDNKAILVMYCCVTE